MKLLGVTLSLITEPLREEYGIGGEMAGVIVTEIDEESEAFEKGLRLGDVISEVAQEKVNRPEDVSALLEAAVDAGRKSILLLVRRGGQPRFIAVNPAG